MSKTVKDVVLSSKAAKIVGLILSIYGIIWGVVEPQEFEWIEKNKLTWQIALPVVSAIVAAILSIRIFSTVLDTLHADGVDRTIQDSFSSTGNPMVVVNSDGHMGNVVSITGRYDKDEMDWPMKAAAQSAGHMEVVFKNNGVFYFYLRVVMLSKGGTSQTTRWLRFDNSLAVADVYRNDPHEMAVGYTADVDGSFNKAVIDIAEAVKQTYGQAGWVYKKATIFRIRCNDGVVASVTFKK